LIGDWGLVIGDWLIGYLGLFDWLFENFGYLKILGEAKRASALFASLRLA
jgi:hypothetical protein